MPLKFGNPASHDRMERTALRAAAGTARSAAPGSTADPANAVLDSRALLVRRSRRLNYATLAYNSLEGILALGAGLSAGSIALVGFGVDSLIELTAGAAALWRLHADAGFARRARSEWLALRLIGLCFVALAIYVGSESIATLAARRSPDESVIGIGLAMASLAVMPFLARAKRTVALELRSGALVAEARQTMICTYLSAILLGGLALNALVGWWWADPVAALAMVPLIAWEGVEGLRGHSACGDGCTSGSGAV
jgi:divalent metal cation (Fe/Co/Zn/Cd) transporter